MLFLHFSNAKLEILRYCSLCLRLKLHGRMPLLHSSNAKLEILRHCSQCCNVCNSISLRYLSLHRTTGNSFHIELLHDNEQDTDRDTDHNAARAES